MCPIILNSAHQQSFNAQNVKVSHIEPTCDWFLAAGAEGAPGGVVMQFTVWLLLVLKVVPSGESHIANLEREVGGIERGRKEKGGRGEGWEGEKRGGREGEKEGGREREGGETIVQPFTRSNRTD